MKDNKKISFFIQDFQGGGAERIIINLANAFVKLGYIVDLLIVRNKGPYKKLVDDKVQVITFKHDKVLFCISELAGYLKKEKPKALFSTLKHVNIAAILANKLSGNSTKSIIREACHLLPSGNKGILQQIAYKLVPFFYKRADVIVAVSKGVAESISSYCNIPVKQIKILPNPSFTDELFKKVKEPNNHPFFNEVDVKIILGVGRLTYQKNFESLIRAFSKVKRRTNKNLKLIILGEGEDRANLEKLINDLNLSKDVSLPGFVDNPYSFMNMASLFVLSSRFEGSPNALIEAMACRTNVIATDCPSGPQEILNSGEYGKLVPVENDEVLASAICEALIHSEDKVVLQKLRSRAMKYHVDSSAQRYLAILSCSD